MAKAKKDRREADIATGARLASPRLMEQADAALDKAEEDAAVLGQRFSEERRKNLAEFLARVRELYSDQGVAKADRPQVTADVADRFREAKDLVSDWLSAATNASEDDSPEILEGFRAGKKIRQSVAKLDAKTETLLPLAKTHRAALLVVRPHTEHFDRLDVLKNLIDESVLNVDPPRVGARQVADELLIGRGCLKRILCENFK